MTSGYFNDWTFFHVYARRAGNSFEFDVITHRRLVALTIYTEGHRCYGGMNRRARIHKTPGITVGSAEGVLAEVDAVVEAHQKRVGISSKQRSRQHGACTFKA